MGEWWFVPCVSPAMRGARVSPEGSWNWLHQPLLSGSGKNWQMLDGGRGFPFTTALQSQSTISTISTCLLRLRILVSMWVNFNN